MSSKHNIWLFQIQDCDCGQLVTELESLEECTEYDSLEEPSGTLYAFSSKMQIENIRHIKLI